MRPVVRHAKWGVAVACLYEAGSIVTGRTPTISQLCGRFPWLGPAIIVGLAVHLARQQPPAPVRVTVDCCLCPEPF